MQNDINGLIRALATIVGLSVVGAVTAWVAGLIWRFGLKRSVQFSQWVSHGAGSGGLLGIFLVLLEWLL